MKGLRVYRLALLAVLVLGLSGLSFGQFYGQVGFDGVGINVGIGVAPPPLPVYDQPPLPAAGYVWTPGYWAWDDEDGYYWVPGTWVQPPEVGMVWTPGYWGWDDADGEYQWNDGYWGTQVGYYGGIDYGYGYPGDGYYGGRWQGNQFYYNNAVENVGNNVVTTVYSNPVPQAAAAVQHVSYNGGQGGTQAQPTPVQVQARQTAKVRATPAQKQQVQAAKANPATHVKNNNGKPAVAATAKPGDFNHAVQAKAAGGHVDAKVLQANAKTTKVNHNPPHKNEAAGAKATTPNRPAEANKPSENAVGRNERNAVPKPSNAGAENGTHARATEPATPRPENSRHESGNAAGMPQAEGAGHHAAAEPARPAQHEAARPESSKEAAPRREAAPSKEAAPRSEKSNERAKPETKDEKPQK